MVESWKLRTSDLFNNKNTLEIINLTTEANPTKSNMFLKNIDFVLNNFELCVGPKQLPFHEVFLKTEFYDGGILDHSEHLDIFKMRMLRIPNPKT